MSARRATRLSFTKLSLFEFCPTAYRYRYVERVPTPFVPRIVVGSIVHSVLHRLFERLQDRRRVDKAGPRPSARRLLERCAARLDR